MKDPLPDPSPLLEHNPDDSIDPLVVVQRLHQEEKQRCKPIDERIAEMETEFYALVKEIDQLVDLIHRNTKFFRAFRLHRQLSKLHARLETNRDLRRTLYNLRFRNS